MRLFLERPVLRPWPPLFEKAEAGHLVYIVFDSQWLTQLPQNPLPRAPQNRFFPVRMSVRSTSSRSVMVPQPDRRKARRATCCSMRPRAITDWRVKDENDEKAALMDIPLTVAPRLRQSRCLAPSHNPAAPKMTVCNV